MFNKPQFQPHFHVETVEPNTVYLMSEQEHIALSGRIYVLLAPLLNGQHTVSEIVEQLKEQIPLLGIYHALTNLESQGYLSETVDVPNEVAAFWSLQNVDPGLAVSKLQEARVSVTAFGDLKTEPFISTARGGKGSCYSFLLPDGSFDFTVAPQALGEAVPTTRLTWNQDWPNPDGCTDRFD